MNTKKITIPISSLIIGIIFTLILTACGASSKTSTNSSIPEQKTDSDIAKLDTVDIEFSYIELTLDEMIEQADMIFVGKVTNITSTSWNQDSGEYWEEVFEEENGLETIHSALPVHQVELSVIQPLVNEDKFDKKVTLTLLGKSPIDNEITVRNSVSLKNDADYKLQIGDEVIIFATQTHVPWRDANKPIEFVNESDGSSYFDIGKRSVIGFVNNPVSSYFLKDKDGMYYGYAHSDEGQKSFSLDNLIQEISKKRAIVQP